MRITSCHIDAFGQFQDRPFEDLDYAAIVMQGGNEAGKSTFFHFLKTMFYGIHPADADRHEYAPRDGRSLEGRASFRLDDGSQKTVARQLLSTPQGQLLNGETRPLHNQTVPAFRHVSRDLFESVYALGLQELVALQGRAWEEIQERLLDSYSAEAIRPAREVVAGLREEANDLWRPAGQWPTRVRKLQERRSVLLREVQEARERNDELRDLHAAVEAHEDRLGQWRSEQDALRVKRRQIERLRPVWHLLQKIERLRDEAGDVDAFEAVPEDPHSELRELAGEAQSMQAELQEKQRRLHEQEEALGLLHDSDEVVLEHSAQIVAWGRKAETYQQRMADIDAAKRERRKARQHLEEVAQRLLTESWYNELAERVRSLSYAAVRDGVKAYEAEADRLQEKREQAETLALHAEAHRAIWPWILIALLGTAGAVSAWGGYLPVEGVLPWSSALALFGLLQSGSAWSNNRKLARQRDAIDVQELAMNMEEHAAHVEELLADLPISQRRLQEPDRDLLADVGDLIEAVSEYDRCTEALQEQAGGILRASKQVSELADACGLDVSPEALVDNVTQLEAMLEEARKRKQRVEQAEQEVPELRRRIRRLQSDLEDRHRRLQQVESLLREAGDGDVAAGVRTLRRQRTAARRATLAEDTLYREYPDWEERKDEIEALEQGGEAWSYSEEEHVRVERQLEDLEARMQEEEKALAAKEAEIEELQEGPMPSEIESEIAHLDEQVDRMQRRRDQLMLLANCIDRANYTFRMKHQPDAIERASRYLRDITDGRYQQLIVDDETRHLLVVEEGESSAVPVEPPLSRGTLDQIYVALRLAIVDHFDADRERLPLFLDEIFVNWDTDRRRQVLSILSQISSERQVFIFTCHPYFAREAADFLGAHHIKLELLDA